MSVGMTLIRRALRIGSPRSKGYRLTGQSRVPCSIDSIKGVSRLRYRREETSRVIAFRSHWGFTSEYCNPASGNEKGGVEGEVGRYRRNWLVPVPEAHDP